MSLIPHHKRRKNNGDADQKRDEFDIACKEVFGLSRGINLARLLLLLTPARELAFDADRLLLQGLFNTIVTCHSLRLRFYGQPHQIHNGALTAAHIGFVLFAQKVQQ